MLFSEPKFLFLFLPYVLILHFLFPSRARNLLLLVASIVFYAVGQLSFLAFLLASVALNYILAIAIEQTRGTRAAKLALAVGILSDLGLLLYFKYANFLVDNLNVLVTSVSHTPLRLAAVGLPLGISFFTFHKMSYKIDIYRGDAAAARNPIDLGLYILFFPQLIAGPIVRYHEIASQLRERTITRSGFAEGIRRFIIGLGKKMLIANTVAVPADTIFAIKTGDLTPGLAWLGILCYSLQIYFDFSGYSDMAIGLAAMFGFRFPENFDHPYASRSVTEFWRRWHMSLSRWFRDYLYIPLGGNRRRPARVYVNLLTVFFLCGLWHGASWNFVVWGLFHGLFLVLERVAAGRWKIQIPPVVQHAYLLLVILVGWVFFRANDLPTAVGYLHAMVGGGAAINREYNTGMLVDRWVILAMAVGAVGSMPLRPAMGRVMGQYRKTLAAELQNAFDIVSGLAADAALALVLVSSASLMAAGTYSPFIYFRF